MPYSVEELSRRKFIGACCAAVGSTGLLSALGQLRLMGAVASPDAATDDYKALVCLFLAGGNDANNLIVPYDTAGYNAYAAARTSLALPRTGLLPFTPVNSDGRSFAFHPALGDMRTLFEAGDLAMLANVGTLVVPTTRSQYELGSVPLPPQLFSHSDQQVQWQSSVPDKPFTTGWGGRLADLVQTFNDNPQVSLSISIAGQNSFQVGNQTIPLSVGRTGVVALTGTNGTPTSAGGVRLSTLKSMMGDPGDGLFESAFGTATNDAIATSALLGEVLAAAPPVTTLFPGGKLGEQMNMITKLISIAPQLGLKRQIFFAQAGGWDMHDDQLETHDVLLNDVSTCLNSFNSAMKELGLNDQVTAFTASDFGRTFSTNGDGSDHGWGSHHLIMGGAVQGKRIFGEVPVLEINGPNDTGRGRWIPTTSVDQYGATLARWFGVSETNLPLVFPNIGRFATSDLGFMS